MVSREQHQQPQPQPPQPPSVPPPPVSLPLPQPLTVSTQRPAAAAPKRSLFDFWKKPNKQKDDSDGSLKILPGSGRSLPDPNAKNTKAPKLDPATFKHNRRRDGSTSSLDSGFTARVIEGSGKGQTGLGKPRLLKRYDTAGSKDMGNISPVPPGESALFDLDTDLTRMDGIISQQPPLTPPDRAGIFTGLGPAEDGRIHLDLQMGSTDASAIWNAPESWAVKKPGDENVSRLREIDEAGVPHKDADDGTPYCVRIFRVDSTFATLSASLNSTVDELLHQLGKKSFLQDDLKNYHIVMRKHDLQKILESGERPMAIQKRLLEQAGYTEADRLDEIGREDNSYLCKFTFVPTRLSGYYSLVSLV